MNPDIALANTARYKPKNKFFSRLDRAYHSDLAADGSRGNRCPSNLRTAKASKVLSSDNLKHLDLMSPTAGPPIILLNSIMCKIQPQPNNL